VQDGISPGRAKGPIGHVPWVTMGVTRGRSKLQRPVEFPDFTLGPSAIFELGYI